MMNNTDEVHNGSAEHHSNNEDLAPRETIVIINCVLNAPLMLISILGNALVLAAIIRTPSIRSTSVILLCSLAVSDFLVGLSAQPLYIARELTNESILHNWLVPIMGFSVLVVTVLTMAAISVDRFMALHYHMRYVTLVTRSRVKYTLVIIWLISFVISGFYFWNNRVNKFLLGVIVIICLLISTFCYIRIFRIVRHHQLQIHAQQQAVESLNAENNTNMLRLKKSAMNTFVFYIALIICYFPSCISLILYGLSYKNRQSEEFRKFSTTIAFMNSSINPFLYCWRLRELRTAVIKTARQLLCKETEEN